MKNDTIDKMSGHWLLAKIGKKVLRPGGKKLTNEMVELLDINTNDAIVEFAPGLGYTTSIVLDKQPTSYIGIDLDEKIIENLNQKFDNQKAVFQLANAADTRLDDCSQTKVFGEAMLTMHANHRKSEIIKEAHRVLKKDGYYAIHELALKPNNISDEIKKNIQKELAITMNVNARPLTVEEWKILVKEEGFEIIEIKTAEMRLLEPSRLIDDEGFSGFLTIIKNIATQTEVRERVIKMKKVFKKYEEHLCAFVMIAKKK